MDTDCDSYGSPWSRGKARAVPQGHQNVTALSDSPSATEESSEGGLVLSNMDRDPRPSSFLRGPDSIGRRGADLGSDYS